MIRQVTIGVAILISNTCISAELNDVQIDKACLIYGKMASAYAADRNNGIPLRQHFSDINRRLGETPAGRELRSLAVFIYDNPAGNKLDPEGAEFAMYADCTIRVGKSKAGSMTYDKHEDIDSVLHDFKSFNGKPLTVLLRGYGVRIASVEITPAEYYKNPQDKPGDKVFLVTLANRPTKAMPCRLKKWIKGEILPMPEFIRRGVQFPLIRPEDDDPLIYWAATGKCSEAYSY